MASGVGIVKAQPGICSWHLTPLLAGNARRSVPRSLSPNCPRRGAGVNGALAVMIPVRQLMSSRLSQLTSLARSPSRPVSSRTARSRSPRSSAPPAEVSTALACAGVSRAARRVPAALRTGGSAQVTSCPACPAICRNRRNDRSGLQRLRAQDRITSRTGSHPGPDHIQDRITSRTCRAPGSDTRAVPPAQAVQEQPGNPQPLGDRPVGEIENYAVPATRSSPPGHVTSGERPA